MQLSENFKDYEFKCKCGKCETILPPAELLDILEELRAYFGRPVTIMSGYRCENHNARVGGATRSKHKLGIASDIIVSGIPAEDVHQYLITRYPDKYGIGNYALFTHIDVRPYKARW